MKQYITEEIRKRAKQIEGCIPKGRLAEGYAISRRDKWEHLASQIDTTTLLEVAEERLGKPFQQLTQEIYFGRDKSGITADKVLFSAMRELEQAVLAECVQYEGKFVPYIIEGIKYMCNLPTWVRPGRDSSFNHAEWNQTCNHIDLYASSAAWRLAVCDNCIGELLDPDLRDLLRHNVKTRVLDVYMDRLNGRLVVPEDVSIVPLYWLDGFDNWLSVCLGGVSMAGLYFGDEKDKSLYIALYEQLIQPYKNSLTDGYCIEGLGYWNYGFGRFIAATNFIAQITDLKVDICAIPEFLNAALFGHKFQITDGVYPSIADCQFGARPSEFLSRCVSKRCGLGYNSDNKVDFSGYIYETLGLCFWDNRLDNTLKTEVAHETLRTYIESRGILISRSADRQFGICIKGGDNQDPHNHNDLGSYVIAVRDEQLILDPGGTRYLPVTFSSNRYTQTALSSFAHGVPLVFGERQGPHIFECGVYKSPPEFFAKVLYTEFSEKRDVICYDLKHAYANPHILELTRYMAFDRESKTITIKDSFSYDKKGAFETAFITLDSINILTSDLIQVVGKQQKLEIKVSGAPHAFNINAIDGVVVGDNIVLSESTRPLYPIRLGISLAEDALCGEICLEISSINNALKNI